MTKNLLNLKSFTLSLVLILASFVVKAQTRTAVADGNWNSVATWGGASVPTSANDVVINDGVDVTVSSAAFCNTIVFGSASGSLTVNSGFTLAVTGVLDLWSSATIATAASIAGAGTITCASLIVGGTFAPSTNSLVTTTLTSTISELSVTNNLTMTGLHGTGNRRNAPIFNLGAGNVSIGGAVTLTADDAGSGATLTLASAPQTGTLTLLGTSLFVDANSSFIANGTNATVNYAGAAQTIRAQAYTDLTLAGSGAKTITGVSVTGKLSLQGTATAAGTSPTYGAAATLEYKGSVAQTTSNVEFVGTGATPANVIIDNTSGVTLNAAKAINGALTLTNGYLTTTNALLLTINAAGSASTTNDAFVNGPLAKLTNTTALFTFPVGTLTGGLRTIGVTPQTTAAATYRATFNTANPRTSVTNGTNLGGLAQVSGCEYWDLSQTAGTTATKVTLSWPAVANSCGTGGYVGNTGSLVVAHHDGTNWTNEGQSAFSGTPSGGGTITSANNLSSFSPFVLATTNANENPLPVMFADVRASQKNSGVEVSWSNLTERDLVSYVVERSANGQSFTAINQQAPRSNTNDKESYSAFDATPLAGVNFYRIKVLEVSGKIIYSKVLKVDLSGKQTGISLYPNPVIGTQVSVSINVKQGQYTVKVMNGAGQQVYSQRLIHQGGSMTQTVELPSSVKPGIYNMMVTGDNYRESKLFIVQ